MSEKVIVRQNSDFEAGFWAADPGDPESDEVYPVEHIHDLTPYGMLLASLGACTAITLHTYAHYHGLKLDEVEMQLQFERVFDEDCKNCEEIDLYEEQINEEIVLTGSLSPEDRKKLLLVSRHCSIRKMIEEGITVAPQLGEGE